MAAELPDPKNGTCPGCKMEQLLVPIWTEDAGKLHMVWKCPNCGHDHSE